MRFPTATGSRQSFVGHRYARLLIGCSVLLVASLGQTASAQTTSKPYTANIVPHQVAAGASTAFTATLVNETDTQQLGSAEITAPPGFVISSTSAGSLDANVVRLRNLGVPPGGSTSVVIQASAPCSAGAGQWQVRAKQSNNFSGQPGNDLSLRAAGSDLTSTIVGSCHLNFFSHPADAAKGSVITTTPFNFPIPGGPIQVEVLDGTNARVTSTPAITVAAPNLSGTLTANAVAGVASFQNLSINANGVYTLTASSAGLGTATSESFTIWESAATCSPGQSCASTAAEGSFSATFSGTSTTKGFLLVSVDRYTKGSLECGDTYSHAPSVTSAATYQFTATSTKVMVGRIAKSDVQLDPDNGVGLYRVCFDSDEPFVGRNGSTVPPGTPALLPDCNAVANVPPCVQSITKTKAGDVIITILLPKDDGFRWR
jgi:hypothetical protein